MLHVTNGTSVSLSETVLGGDVLAWIDALHEGPVPAGLGPAGWPAGQGDVGFVLAAPTPRLEVVQPPMMGCRPAP